MRGVLAGLSQRAAMLAAALERLDEVAAEQARLAAEIAELQRAYGRRLAPSAPAPAASALDRAA